MKSENSQVFPLGLTRKVWLAEIFKFLSEVIIASLLYFAFFDQILSIQRPNSNITNIHLYFTTQISQGNIVQLNPPALLVITTLDGLWLSKPAIA